MTKINLLPWREKRRQKQQKNYQIILIMIAISGIFTAYSLNQYFDLKINHQMKRNNFLLSEVKHIDEKIIEIKELHKTRGRLIERMKLIQDLQGNRPIIVRIFDELVTAVPDDLFLMEVELQGNQIRLVGSSKLNSHVSSFMRNLDASDWFSNPGLIRVNQSNDGLSHFEILLQQVEPDFSQDSELGNNGA